VRDHNGPPMEALLRKVSVGVLVSRLGTLALVIAITVAVNEPEDWQPIELVVALACSTRSPTRSWSGRAASG
jgi:hypothetical protein